MRILSIDGGGYLGLSTATFIEGIEQHFGKSFASNFDLFCGTSTGAIIALALASGLSGKEIHSLYEDFGPKVFNNRIPGRKQVRIFWGFLFSRYSNKPLRNSLQATFQNRTLGDLYAANKRVLITAFSLTTGRPRIFKTDHSPELSRDNKHLICDIALASSSAPTYLPLVKIADPTNGAIEAYCDGGVFANHPALLGFTEALYHCRVEAKDIQVLSLSTPRASLAEHESSKTIMERQLNRGALGWGWNGKLANIFIDANSSITHETLRRLVARSPGAVYERILLNKPEGVEIDTTHDAATRTLRQIGFDAAGQGEVRARIASFFPN